MTGRLAQRDPVGWAQNFDRLLKSARIRFARNSTLTDGHWVWLRQLSSQLLAGYSQITGSGCPQTRPNRMWFDNTARLSQGKYCEPRPEAEFLR
jgi:hypothetical protein